MFPGETILTKPQSERKNPHFSEFQVIKSNQFYIGTMFISCGDENCKECGKDEYPRANYEKGRMLDYNSRETDYFKSEAAAIAALEKYQKTGVLDNQRY